MEETTHTHPSESPAAARCRGCGKDRGDLLVDLGQQPDPDMLLDPNGSSEAPIAAVRAWICSSCGLVQLVGPRPDWPRMPHGHPSAAVSSALLADPRTQRVLRLLPADHRHVVRIDETEAGTVAIVDANGGPSTGIPPEPDGSGFDEPWFPTIPLGGATTESPRIPDRQAGLVLVGHALTHADEPDGLMRAIESTLAPGGLVAIEFHHVLGLAQGQFDVLSHAHRSYLSLHSLERLLARHGLTAVTAERVRDYGGTVRVLAGRSSLGNALRGASPAVEQIEQLELDARVHVASGFEALPGQVARGRAELRGYFERTRRDATTVAGYGAAARGTALLNIAGIGPEQLPFIVDRAANKQGRLLPGCRIPVHDPGELERARPDDILILPWPLASEIVRQLAGARDWGARFLVAMPRLETLA